jgi:VPDSG-CTERM motif
MSVVPDLAFPPQWGWSGGTGGDGVSYQDFEGTRSASASDMAFTLNGGPAGVPDAGSTLSLLGFASLGLVALRRKLRC